MHKIRNYSTKRSEIQRSTKKLAIELIFKPWGSGEYFPEFGIKYLDKKITSAPRQSLGQTGQLLGLVANGVRASEETGRTSVAPEGSH